MTTQINIQDYTFDSIIPGHGWAKVKLFGKSVEFNFTRYDAVTAGIELGLVEQPEDRDCDRIGYEKPMYSRTVLDAEPTWRVFYTQNEEILSELSGTDFAEQIVSHLALQSSEVREAIQAEATSIACCDIAPGITDPADIKYHVLKQGFQREIPVDWEKVSQHKKLSLRTENKLVEKLL